MMMMVRKMMMDVYVIRTYVQYTNYVDVWIADLMF